MQIGQFAEDGERHCACEEINRVHPAIQVHAAKLGHNGGHGCRYDQGVHRP